MIDWDSEYSLLITATGWTYEYIDEFVTLPRLEVLHRYWRDRPPVHITAALFAGIEPVSKSKPRQIANLWQGIEVMNDERFGAMLRPQAGVAMQNIRLPR